MLLIQAEGKPELTRLLSHMQDGTRGLPLVVSHNGPWAVIWGPGYDRITVELDCCRYSFPTPESFPSEDFRCPHGNWLVRYA